MNQKKKMLFLSILLMAVGFASVSTILYLNGQTFVASNTGDFDVYYSKAVENGTENASIIKDKTHIEFTTELTGINDKYVLDYDVTNGSKQYDANLVMNCVGGNEYLRVENKFDTTEILPARTTRSGRLTLTVIKVPLTEISVFITCEISGNAAEREEIGGETIDIDRGNYLKINEIWDEEGYLITNSYFGYDIDRSKVEAINIVNSTEIPNDATFIGDVSNKQNRSIMMYSRDEDNNNLLELYIGQDGGVRANPDSTGLFYDFENITNISGLENLDTSNVTSMDGMFFGCSSLTTLDVSRFDTSQVTNMSNMFSECSNLTSLDVSGFDTSQVTNMSNMFSGCSNLTSLDLSNFNTSNLYYMMGMFNYCTELVNLNLDSFDTTNVVELQNIFNRCYKVVTTITLKGELPKSWNGDDSNEAFLNGAATEEGSSITLNYTDDTSELVDIQLGAYLRRQNIKKGINISTIPITIEKNDTVVVNYTKGYKGQKIRLFSTDDNKIVRSFKVNGELINGPIFVMPDTEVVITDVVVKDFYVIETDHNPYGDNLENQVIGEKTFEGATSLTIILDYETENWYVNDWIYLYDSTGREYGKYWGFKRTETITIPGNYIKAVFRTDSWNNYYYGFKASIVPNYD